jgi:NADH-quinone oxidoreductase subunit L
MSQIGFMMFALGLVGAHGVYTLGYTASLFHLFTHAFFKSLLFLGAGAIIHFVHSNELKDMGGLRKFMPLTHLTFLIACLAIAGIPPFAGFFSKEEILLTAYEANKLIYAVALLTSGLTAFYMFRLYFSIFWNKEKVYENHHGEGTLSMKLPLILLGALTIGAGFLPFGSFVSINGKELESHFSPLFSIAPVAAGLIGIGLAIYFYLYENECPEKYSKLLGGFYKSAYHKFYIDELYLFITSKVIFNLVGRPAAWIDQNLVDGLMNGIAKLTGLISESIKGLQSGKVQQYVLYFFGGVLALAVVFLYWWK